MDGIPFPLDENHVCVFFFLVSGWVHQTHAHCFGFLSIFPAAGPSDGLAIYMGFRHMSSLGEKRRWDFLLCCCRGLTYPFYSETHIAKTRQKLFPQQFLAISFVAPFTDYAQPHKPFLPCTYSFVFPSFL